MEKTAKKAQSLETAMQELENTRIPTDEYKAVQEQIQKAQTKLGALNDRMEKFLEMGGSENSKTFKSMQYDMEQLENTIAYAKGELEDMEKSGTAFQNPKGTEKYQQMSDSLRDTNNQMEVLKKKEEEVAAKAGKVGGSAKNIEKVGKAAKKSAGLMSTLMPRLKGITLSLLIFNWISKGFRAMIDAFKDGIKNMAKHSKDFNSRMSEMKSATSTLRASLGTMIAPIASVVIPGIVNLCNWLTTAINKVNEFIAVASGKGTWTRAKKQQTDYAKSLNSTAGAAKKASGALASFDDLNVLSKNDSGGGGGASSDLYEEVPTGNALAKKMQPFFDFLKRMKAEVNKGWDDTWKRLDIDSQVSNIKTSIASIKKSLIGVLTSPEVSSAASKCADTIAYSIGQTAASIVSVSATIGENLLGGLSMYLDSDSDRIQGFLVRMFDITSDVSELAGNAAEAFAYVFEAFGSSSGQKITADIIKMFADMVGGIVALLYGIGKDVLHFFIDPFVNNQQAFRTALDGYLVALQYVVDTYTELFQQVSDGLMVLYDEHIHPFIQGITDGVSELIEAFLEFWNTYMQPLLEQWGQMFEDTYQSHLKPVVDRIIAIIGQIIDIVKIMWHNNLEPLIGFIKNILPVIMPVLNMLSHFVKGIIDGIIDFVGGLLNAIGDVLDIIIDLLTGDWKGAWESAKNVVKDVVNGILSAIEAMANGVNNGINALIRALNGLHFSIPDWVPALGGKSFGFSLRELSPVHIPRLANGGITTGSTLANIGEAGREAILPLENNTGWMDDFADKLASRMPDYGGAREVSLVLDGQALARGELPYIMAEQDRIGLSFA